MPRGIGSIVMRRELNLIVRKMQLLQQLARVSMSKDSIRREIIRSIHKVGLRGRSLARSAHTRLRIANNPTLQINHTCQHKRSQRQNN